MSLSPIACGARLATVTVARSGLVTLSNVTCEFLGWPETVATAAVEGGLLIVASNAADSRPVSYNVGYSPNASNGRIRCRADIQAAGLLRSDATTRYLALACEDGEGRAAVLVRPVDTAGPMFVGRRRVMPSGRVVA